MTEAIIRETVSNYLYFTMFIGYAIGVWGWHKAKDLRAVPILLLVTFVAQMFMFYWAVMYRNNALIAHIFGPIQFIILMAFFKQNFRLAWEKKAVLYLAIVMVIYSLINSWFLQNTKTFPSNFIIVATLLQIILSVNLLLHKLDSVSTKINIFKEPVFLTAMAIFTFNIFSFFIFLINNYLLEKNIGNKGTGFVLLFVGLLYYTLLLLSLIFSLKKSIHTRAKN